MTSDNIPITRRRQTGIFNRSIANLPRFLLTSNNVAINSKRRQIPLTFLPPSTNSPLFVYNNESDQRSFLSLCSGSYIDSHTNNAANSLGGDDESVSTFRSLPSTLDVDDGEIESIHQWLDEERERRSLLSADDNIGSYGSTNDDLSLNEEEERDILQQVNKRFRSAETSSRRSSIFTLEGIIKDEEDEDFAHEQVTKHSEARKLARYTVPLVITFFLEQIFSLVCVVFVGHLGKEELAAVSMASMTSTIVLAIFEGIATSLDTLCPQAYGAGQYVHVGIHTQRCVLFSLVLFIPAGLFWYFSGFFLSFIVEDAKVIHLTQKFLRIFIFAGPPYIFFENGKRFLQAQGIFDAGTYILFITAPVNVLMNWLLVYSETFGVGYSGAPIASVINFWLMFTLLVLYVMYVDGASCWGGLTKNALSHWYDLSKLAIPGIVMLLAESLAYEILTLFASRFGTSALACQSALSSIVSLLYMIPFALAVASSTRTASFIGSENIFGAKTSINVGFMAAVAVGFINFLLIFCGSDKLALVFTNDEEVISMFVKLCPLISIFVIFDSLSCVANGTLRALAMQMVGGALSLIGYYAIAVPLAIFLCFNQDLELTGLWLGNGFGLFTIAFTETIIIYRVNWVDIINKSKKLTMHEDASL
jgi:multidrug resistance protein, MATE family